MFAFKHCYCCLLLQGREPLFVPCTPLGCIELLDRIGTDIAGKRAVVVGRSNIVGMPVALLLNKRNATVTICHSAAKDMAYYVREADIVIAAAGQAALIKVSTQLGSAYRYGNKDDVQPATWEGNLLGFAMSAHFQACRKHACKKEQTVCHSSFQGRHL